MDPIAGSYSSPGAIPSLADFIPLGDSQEGIPFGQNLTDPTSLLTSAIPGGGFASRLATGDIQGGPFEGGDTSTGPSDFNFSRGKVSKTFNIGKGAGAGLDTKMIAIIAGGLLVTALAGFLIFKAVKK